MKAVFSCAVTLAVVSFYVFSCVPAVAQDATAEDYMAFLGYFVGDWNTTVVTDGGKTVMKGTWSCELAPTKQCFLTHGTIDGEPDGDSIDAYDPATKSWKITWFGADGSHSVGHTRLDLETLKGMPIGKTIRGKSTIVTKEGEKKASEWKVLVVNQDRYQLESTLDIFGGEFKEQVKIIGRRQPPSYKHLESLEYFVGTWVAQGTIPESDGGPFAGEKYVVRSKIEWILKKNAQRNTVEGRIGGVVFSNMGLTGWDPAAEQIKTWGLNAGGGRGEGTITKDGENWVFKGVNIQSDGTKSQANSIVIIMDDGSHIRRLTDREKPDGTPLPDLDVTFRRVKPKRK